MSKSVKIILVLALVTLCAVVLVGIQLDSQAKQLISRLDFDKSEALEIPEVGPVVRLNFGRYDTDNNNRLERGEVRSYIVSQLIRGVRRSSKNPVDHEVFRSSVVTENEMKSALDLMVAQLGLPGAAFVGGHNGNVQIRISSGNIAPTTVVPIASASKWLSSATILRMVEEGLFELDQPLGSLVPNYGPHWQSVTWRQLFSHTSGAGKGHATDFPPQNKFVDQINELLKLPAQDIPGASFSYGGISMQVGGFGAERISGKRWSQLFNENLAAPLNMVTTFYGHPMWHMPGATIRSPNIAGGVHSSADEYGKFLGSLFPGQGAARPLLSVGSITQIESDHTSTLPQIGRPPGVDESWHYGLGVWCEKPIDGKCTSVNSAGAFGTFPWINRSTGSYGVLVTIGSIHDVLPYALTIRELFEKFLEQSSGE